MKRLAALAAGRADQNNVSYRIMRARLRLHLRDCVFNEPEDAIEIDRQCRTPLLVRHSLDGHIRDGPDSVIRDEYVDPSEMLDCLCDQGAGGLRTVQIAGDRVTGLGARFFGQCFSLIARAAIAESNLCTGGGEHAHSSGADSARSAGDESNLTRER